MTFYSKSLSQKLQNMGCVSESGFYWVGSEVQYLGYIASRGDFTPNPKLTPYSLSPYDFCGPSETARKNAEIRWPGKFMLYKCVDGKMYREGCPVCGHITASGGYLEALYHRHKMIDLPEEEQEAYMTRGLI